MKKFNGTTGEWKSRLPKGSTGFVYVDTENTTNGSIATCYSGGTSKVQAKANGKLIADAGNTVQKCNLLPSELLAQRDELLAACKNLENDNGVIPAHAWNMIQAAIEKATKQ